MSLATIRSAIKTRMETITGIENVQDYVIWSDDWDDLLTYFVKDGRVNTWQIGLTSISPLEIDSGNRKTTFNFSLYGLYSIKTADKTSQVFENLCELVLYSFGTSYNPIEIAGARMFQFPSLTTFENTLFMQTPAHRATISMQITEYVAQDLLCKG